MGTVTTRQCVKSMEDLKLFARRYGISPQLIEEGDREKLIELTAEHYARARAKEYAGQTLEQFAAGHVVQLVTAKVIRHTKSLDVVNNHDKGDQDVIDSISKARKIARKIAMQNQSASEPGNEPQAVDPEQPKNYMATNATKSVDTKAQLHDQTEEKSSDLTRKARPHDDESPLLEATYQRPSR